MTYRKEVHLVDEILPLKQLASFGLQHVLVMYAGAVAVPLILGSALAGCGKTRAVRPFPVEWTRKSRYPRVIARLFRPVLPESAGLRRILGAVRPPLLASAA